jgi:hypothetical protein
MAHLTDMEELLASVSSTSIRDYMREAMNCYMARAYRGCIVLSYIALFDDLLAKLEQLGKVNSDAKTIFQQAWQRRSDQDVYESYLIDQLSSKKLLSMLDSEFLGTLRTLRNKSAHPSGHKPSPEEARFIYFETISRFLARPILSTTQLVDEIVSRLSNANFFPSLITSDMKTVAAEEIATLHDEAIPQLIIKLVNAKTSADTNIAKNSGYLLIGLTALDRADINQAIQSRLINAKADDPAYSEIVLETISTNGSLFVGLSPTVISRLRSSLGAQIDELTAALGENKLIHPLHILGSVAKHLSEDSFYQTFKPELEKLFIKATYSPALIKILKDRPTIFSEYFPKILSNAGSSDFTTANNFSTSIVSIESQLSQLVSDEQAFQLMIGIKRAAEWNAFGAQALVRSKYSNVPRLKAKSLAYMSSSPAEADSYAKQKIPDFTSITDFEKSDLISDDDPAK